jgi:kinesin family protein 15
MFTMVGKPITEAFMGGYNATVFAYGQTGSGKTFTIQGGLTDRGELIHEHRGLIPRIFEYLFDFMKSSSSSNDTTYFCKCSFLEIYNEQITDLLEPASTMMQIREDAKRGVYVEGLREESVDSAR